MAEVRTKPANIGELFDLTNQIYVAVITADRIQTAIGMLSKARFNSEACSKSQFALSLRDVMKPEITYLAKEADLLIEKARVTYQSVKTLCDTAGIKFDEERTFATAVHISDILFACRVLITEFHLHSENSDPSSFDHEEIVTIKLTHVPTGTFIEDTNFALHPDGVVATTIAHIKTTNGVQRFKTTFHCTEEVSPKDVRQHLSRFFPDIKLTPYLSLIPETYLARLVKFDYVSPKIPKDIQAKMQYGKATKEVTKPILAMIFSYRDLNEIPIIMRVCKGWQRIILSRTHELSFVKPIVSRAIKTSFGQLQSQYERDIKEEDS